MADTCEESSSEGSDSILSDNFSIFSESSTSDEDEQNKEASASFPLVKSRKSRSEKSNTSSKQAKSNNGVYLIYFITLYFFNTNKSHY